MKKIFVFILMTAAMLTASCVFESENDAVYEISLGTTSYSVGGTNPAGVAYQAAEEVKAQVRDFSQHYLSQWVCTYTSNNTFQQQESDAVLKWEEALAAFQKIHDSFVTKYGSTPSDGSTYECTYKLYLKRNDPSKGDAVVCESAFVFEIK
ncbi:MAG: hypothetical protein KBT44_05670 [Bacteroidales bacterium]|nr:hypothetical protein [Candidatus Equibacterium intestinale]